ncbi:hypothetical protein O9Z70_15170 [Devosia sp. YIM 151766]|uniref:ImuA family protein n=1 Tax=Devosia sp. YIM 151766 TaxID=3017325 RepID=UPI00255CBEBD|nr:hypothetical protein [Devosia sp. YIM 151766]WIY52774.1 hypothetical protein O9Z70_15170 [Devosia sp. YIM 151766]
MQTPSRQQRLAALRDVIADIERKPALLEPRHADSPAADGAFPAFSGGLVQEVFTDAVRNGGASLAFALGQGKGLLTARRPALIFLQLAGDGRFFGLPYGPGLSHFGVDPAQVIIVRPADMGELLWAAEEALGCAAVAGIVAEIGAMPAPLDFTASRRLSLRAAETGTSLFLLRYGTGREASAAHLRWHLAPGRSARQRHDPVAPGAARWHLRLERGVTVRRQGKWLLEWTENGFASLPARSHGPDRLGAGKALSRAVPAALADRLSQTA